MRNKKRKQDHANSGNQNICYNITLFSEEDLFLFNEGKHYRLYQKLGAHTLEVNGTQGTYFAVWAPNAKKVSVIGDFNGWNKTQHCLKLKGISGIWEGFIPNVQQGAVYKYHINSKYNNFCVDKADPLATFCEVPPRTGSIVWGTHYIWSDQDWMSVRHSINSPESPVSIYEVHLSSWVRVPEEDNRYLSYRELAPKLADYVSSMGFTHVEFMPVMEHPFRGSWGYQTTGYFAPSSRQGSPQDFMYLINYLHASGIGVILDWVPSHFPADEHGLGYFDGTHLFEHADFRQGHHPDWDTLIFNYGRKEVRAFLISCANFWLDKYHADGLRFDGVSSMLYLDYSRKEGEWKPNQYGGRENLDAMDFLKTLNSEVYRSYPDVHTIAEEATSWPLVSRPTYVGGLGFGMKWDMGWMHDTLNFFSKEPLFRKHFHNLLTFRTLYAFSENFVLPLSHDEVVYGKGSLLGKMPGDAANKFANLKLLLGYMFAQPGKKLLFMGSELAQIREWNHDSSLDWHLLERPDHANIRKWVEDLNRIYRTEKALHEMDFDSAGFKWIDANDVDQSTLSFIRIGRSSDEVVLVTFNFTPVPRFDYRIGAPYEGKWKELLNSDAAHYGGHGYGNQGMITAQRIPLHGQPYSIRMTLPPLTVIFLKHV